MKNILQIHVCTTIDQLEDPLEIELKNGKHLFFQRGTSIRGDVSDELWESLIESTKDFTADMEIYFCGGATQIDWELYKTPQEVEILFEEQYEYFSGDEGIECDYIAEYLGIFNWYSLSLKNCYGGEK